MTKKIARQIAMIEDALTTSAAELGPAKVTALQAELNDLKAQANEMIPVPAGTPYFAPIPVRVPCQNTLVQDIVEEKDTDPCVDEIGALGGAEAVSGPVSVRFLLAGDAIFTVSNPEGVRYTFKVSRPEDHYRGEYFVSLLTGPNNNADYSYMGMLHAETFGFRLTKKSKVMADSLPVRVFNFAVTRIRGLRPIPEGYSILHEGKCGRCGLRLTVPASIQRGIGPECAGLQPGELSKSQKKRRERKKVA